jgi:hypothetical protein
MVCWGDSGFRFVDAYYNIVKARERATEIFGIDRVSVLLLWISQV